MSVYRFPGQRVELTHSGQGGKRFQRFSAGDELIILDFGSARHVTSNHTRSLLIFSEGYAPYEQYLQGQLTQQGPWTDVYAITATLYFMLTGCRLPSAMDRQQAQLLQQPDPLKPARHFVPELPAALDAVLMRGWRWRRLNWLRQRNCRRRHFRNRRSPYCWSRSCRSPYRWNCRKSRRRNRQRQSRRQSQHWFNPHYERLPTPRMGLAQSALSRV